MFTFGAQRDRLVWAFQLRNWVSAGTLRSKMAILKTGAVGIYPVLNRIAAWFKAGAHGGMGRRKLWDCIG